VNVVVARRLHEQLYSKIEEVETSESLDRRTFRADTESLLRELMAMIPEIKFIDDYRWIVAAIRQWEIYLRDSFGVIS